MKDTKNILFFHEIYGNNFYDISKKLEEISVEKTSDECEEWWNFLVKTHVNNNFKDTHGQLREKIREFKRYRHRIVAFFDNLIHRFTK